jgi:hypothetical protein
MRLDYGFRGMISMPANTFCEPAPCRGTVTVASSAPPPRLRILETDNDAELPKSGNHPPRPRAIVIQPSQLTAVTLRRPGPALTDRAGNPAASCQRIEAVRRRTKYRVRCRSWPDALHLGMSAGGLRPLASAPVGA